MLYYQDGIWSTFPDIDYPENCNDCAAHLRSLGWTDQGRKGSEWDIHIIYYTKNTGCGLDYLVEFCFPGSELLEIYIPGLSSFISFMNLISNIVDLNFKDSKSYMIFVENSLTDLQEHLNQSCRDALKIDFSIDKGKYIAIVQF